MIDPKKAAEVIEKIEKLEGAQVSSEDLIKTVEFLESVQTFASAACLKELSIWTAVTTNSLSSVYFHRTNRPIWTDLQKG